MDEEVAKEITGCSISVNFIIPEADWRDAANWLGAQLNKVHNDYNGTDKVEYEYGISRPVKIKLDEWGYVVDWEYE